MSKWAYFKIIAGAGLFILFINSLSSISFSNAQTFGYDIFTLVAIIIGVWLVYSGFKTLRKFDKNATNTGVKIFLLQLILLGIFWLLFISHFTFDIPFFLILWPTFYVVTAVSRYVLERQPIHTYFKIFKNIIRFEEIAWLIGSLIYGVGQINLG